MHRAELVERAHLAEVVDRGAVLFIGLRELQTVAAHRVVARAEHFRAEVKQPAAADARREIDGSAGAVGVLGDRVVGVGVAAQRLEAADHAAADQFELQAQEAALRGTAVQLDHAVGGAEDLVVERAPGLAVGAGGHGHLALKAVVDERDALDHRLLGELEDGLALAGRQADGFDRIRQDQRVGLLDALGFVHHGAGEHAGDADFLLVDGRQPAPLGTRLDSQEGERGEGEKGAESHKGRTESKRTDLN